VPISQYATRWNPTAICTAGNYLYLMESVNIENVGDCSCLETIDISDPVHPVQASIVDTSHDAQGVQVDGRLAYLTHGFDGLQVFDVGNPTLPVLLGSRILDGYARDVVISGNQAYVTWNKIYTNRCGITIFDIGQSNQPAWRGSVELEGTGECVFIAGHCAYFGQSAMIGDRQRGRLVIIDISQPESPKQLGSFDLRSTVRNIKVADSVAYVVTSEVDLEIINVSNPVQPMHLCSFDMQSMQGIWIANNHVFMAGGGQFRVVDVSNPSQPSAVALLDNVGDGRQVYVHGQKAFIAGGQDGVVVIDISNPTQPVPVGKIRTYGDAVGITVSGDYAYVADYAQGLDIFRIGSPLALGVPILTDKTLILFWPGAPGLKLQSTRNLSPATNWEDVPGSDGSSRIEWPLSSTNTFFRLVRP
jgi:hypothetical protein